MVYLKIWRQREMSEQKTLMTQGTIWKILVRFAFPLFVGSLFQQLYNAVDSWVVGNYDGKTALAAVSSAGSLCFLLIGFFQGTFIGASVIISRYYGARDMEKVDKAVHTSILFALLLGTVLSVVGVLFTPTILAWMGTPANVMPNSVAYFRIWCAGMLGLVLYNTASGIFQSMGDSRHPLYFLILSAFLNLVLDLLFVAKLGMGVTGAALATVIGQSCSAVLAFGYLMSGRFQMTVSLKKLRPDGAIFKNIFRLGIPSGVQNSVIAIANVVVQSNINAFGDGAMAGCGSYSRIEGFVFLPITSLTMALTTFVGQNLGAGDQDRVRRGVRTGTLMTVCLAEVVAVVEFVLAPFLISIFNQEPEVVAYGVREIRVISLFYCLLAFSHAAAATLRGVGKAMVPMLIMLCIWCVVRISYITLMVRIIPDITVVFTAYPLTWFLSSILFAIYLAKVDWLTPKSHPDHF